MRKTKGVRSVGHHHTQRVRAKRLSSWYWGFHVKLKGENQDQKQSLTQMKGSRTGWVPPPPKSTETQGSRYTNHRPREITYQLWVIDGRPSNQWARRGACCRWTEDKG